MNAPERLSPLDPQALGQHVTQTWQREIVRELQDYIAIPAKSPMFDPDWVAHGHLERVVQRAADWLGQRQVRGLRWEIVRLQDSAGRPRTPVLFFEIPATRPEPSASSTASTPTVLMYGHLDKQPEFSGWRADLGPWTPRLIDGRLYGRGGADDGYAVYASVAAVEALQAQGIPHPRIVGLIETDEESGSGDLPAYIDALRPRLGDVSLVVCLDSGAGNYEQLWLTTSLRGLVSGALKVEVLEEGVHSGDASGVVPSSFRILRHVLNRLEDSATGALLPQSFHVEIPANRIAQAQATAAVLGVDAWRQQPWACGADGNPVLPMTSDPTQALLNRTWRPTLSVTGAEGLPPLSSAGNVLRPHTAFKLSLRLPPTVDANQAAESLKALLELEPPYNARVTFVPDGRAGAWGANGWDAPALSPWLEQALNQASQAHFGAPVGYIGQGGTIPLMNLLQQGFPQAQMMVCGVLGPKSNAHGPNEFIDVPYAQRLTAAVAQVMANHP